MALTTAVLAGATESSVQSRLSMHPLSVLAFLQLSTSTLKDLLDTFGYPMVGVFVAIESSGIPFPGETMLITAAVYAGSGGHLSIEGVIVAAAVGAFVGDNLGYAAGRFGGRPLVIRFGRYVRLKPKHLDRAERFFARYGDKTVFFGRFVAVLRAWSALLAGTNRMPWPRFLLFNAAGGIVWATVYGLLGYTLGHNLPLLDRVLHVLGVGGIALAVLVIVGVWLVWRRRRTTSG
jgi:membrane protein DedA with SNARE-associated domain